MLATSETKETNINVVVRVRPRSSREIKDNSPACISTQGREVTVKPHSGMDATTKTYTFDKVFGPESNQETIFRQVVQGMLSEVLMGYNCTIFAYGQTGTGKTYTMEGDMDNPFSPQSGIIPRTLLSLFDTLESESAEYSVRVSYVELYNEELKDLLSPIDAKLRVFEDLARKGSVIIQNLEEILVRNASDVIQILQQGATKRQIASTKMNDFSSRSHAIFSITVHIRETTPEGEELLKVGKLNLVDLAGSENIGRSGAENRRAKEAGMINQSLLTLGRVINALVERSPHIPYRESKLTRLLQDSLGGRTKTCIIAAVSPAKCNLEESLSTLEYAHRAKNIRNKPEVNQKMTKKALIKEYATEIERLKSDLLATREKNGIFLSPESYQSLIDELASKKDRIDELNKSLVVRDEQIEGLKGDVDAKQKQLRVTMDTLNQVQVDLATKTKEFDDLTLVHTELQSTLEKTELLLSYRKDNETLLDTKANSLLENLQECNVWGNLLYKNVEYKKELEQLNQTNLSSLSDSFLTQFNGLLENAYPTVDFEIISKEKSNLLETFDSLERLFKTNIEAIKERIQPYEHQDLFSSLQHQLEELQVAFTTLFVQNYQPKLTHLLDSYEQVLKDKISVLKSESESCFIFYKKEFEHQLTCLDELHSNVAHNLTNYITHLQDQHVALVHQFEDYKVKTNLFTDRFQTLMMGELDGFKKEISNSSEANIQSLDPQKPNELRHLISTHQTTLLQLKESLLQDKETRLSCTINGLEEALVLEDIQRTIQQCSLSDVMQQHIKEISNLIEKNAEDYHLQMTTINDGNEMIKEATTEFQVDYSKEISNLSPTLTHSLSQVTNSLETLEQSLETHKTTSQSTIDSLLTELESFTYKVDQETIPHKEFNLEKDWENIKSDEDILFKEPTSKLPRRKLTDLNQ